MEKKSLSNLVPTANSKETSGSYQKPAPRPPVAVVGPSTVAAPFAQDATLPFAQPAQSDLAALDAPDNIANNRMLEDNEYLLDQP